MAIQFVATVVSVIIFGFLMIFFPEHSRSHGEANHPGYTGARSQIHLGKRSRCVKRTNSKFLKKDARSQIPRGKRSRCVKRTNSKFLTKVGGLKKSSKRRSKCARKMCNSNWKRLSDLDDIMSYIPLRARSTYLRRRLDAELKLRRAMSGGCFQVPLHRPSRHVFEDFIKQRLPLVEKFIGVNIKDINSFVRARFRLEHVSLFCPLPKDRVCALYTLVDYVPILLALYIPFSKARHELGDLPFLRSVVQAFQKVPKYRLLTKRDCVRASGKMFSSGYRYGYDSSQKLSQYVMKEGKEEIGTENEILLETFRGRLANVAKTFALSELRDQQNVIRNAHLEDYSYGKTFTAGTVTFDYDASVHRDKGDFGLSVVAWFHSCIDSDEINDIDPICEFILPSIGWRLSPSFGDVLVWDAAHLSHGTVQIPFSAPGTKAIGTALYAKRRTIQGAIRQKKR